MPSEDPLVVLEVGELKQNTLVPNEVRKIAIRASSILRIEARTDSAGTPYCEVLLKSEELPVLAVYDEIGLLVASINALTAS
ncbi:hypothetical protein [Enterovirga aerilata]|uniref:Uncharacterized protein n=1 Tax=Enterovirga aerilata TaxID=2730920 RepID=A0A849I469_9HYPH|nr:hypothetical protein [Enterovirga sp. DB1703]NNM74626.1 hypothetical protein [Enterovirga sp. DB1703]